MLGIGEIYMSDLSRAERRDIKRQRRRERNAKRNPQQYESDTFQSIPVIQDYAHPRVNLNDIQAKTEAQYHYQTAIDQNTVTMAIGPAGTGKTFVSVAKACEYLESKKVDRIILTRPLEDSESNRFGALPGELDQKFDPYIAPMRILLDQFLGKSKVEAYLRTGKIVAMPLAFIRGHTLDNCFVICSEMQNSTPTTMKLILTRIGKYTKLVIDGDVKQKDIKGFSGLEDAVRRLNGVKGVSTIEFTKDDIVRSDIVRYILDRYET